MELRESQTYKNLMTAYAGEREAGGKYVIYAKKAREDGYQQIGNIFDDTASNEFEHAEIWLKWLSGGEVPPTLENLADAAAGERYEWTQMYKNFAETARQEGYCELASLFEKVGAIERSHDARYRRLGRNIENDEVFCKPQSVAWVCMVCGHVTYGDCSPEICPVCGHEQAYTEIKAENY